MTASETSLRSVLQASRTIASRAVRTPLVESPALERRLGAPVRLKLECFQRTGSFKFRGALNAILNLGEVPGVATMSTGNHGRAVAYASSLAGVRATVCMSNLVPENKVRAIRDLGAEVLIRGESQDEAGEEVRRLVSEEGLAYIPPFDHADVIAGQGTVGLELLEDFPELEHALVPLSGGGLTGGIAIVLKAASSGIRVTGVSMERGPAMYLSQQAGRPVAVREETSLADSLGGGIGSDNRFTFALVRDLVDDMILVSEKEIAEGMRFLYREEALVTEGAAAAGVAALLSNKAKPEGNTALVVSGRNVDMNDFTRIVTA